MVYFRFALTVKENQNNFLISLDPNNRLELAVFISKTQMAMCVFGCFRDYFCYRSIILYTMLFSATRRFFLFDGDDAAGNQAFKGSVDRFLRLFLKTGASRWGIPELSRFDWIESNVAVTCFREAFAIPIQLALEELLFVVKLTRHDTISWRF